MKRGDVEIVFQNEGKKIPGAKLQTIFEKFYRLDDSRSTETGGAGLGLAIAREIVELHGGRIIAKSDDNKTTVQNTVKLYQDAISKIQKNGTKTNLVNPNKYLWKYTDRYLQSPVGTSQYVYETDTVPFLQMVLNGTMEVYAPYANFSFYAQTDMLRMIDTTFHHHLS